jgi:hypothetical protein
LFGERQEDTSGELHGIGIAAVVAVADYQRPQPIDLDGLAIAGLHFGKLYRLQRLAQSKLYGA